MFRIARWVVMALLMVTADAGAQPLTYVLDANARSTSGSGSTTVNLKQINTATGTHTATILVVPNAPLPSPYDLAISPDGTTAFVTWGDLYMVDLATHAVSKAGIGTHLGVMTSSRDGARLFIRDHSSPRFVVFNTVDRRVEAVIDVPTAGGVVAPDGSRVYTMDSQGVVSVFDVASARVVATYPTTGEVQNLWPGSRRIALSPDGQRLFVSFTGNFNSILALDAATGGRVGQLDLDRYAQSSGVFVSYSQVQQLGILPDGEKLYVLLNAAVVRNIGEKYVREDRVAVVDTATMALRRVVPVFRGAVSFEYFTGGGVAVADDGSTVVVAGGFGTGVIDPVTDELTLRGQGVGMDDLALGARPHCFAELSTHRILTRQSSEQVVVHFPVAADCDWSATITRPFFSLTPAAGRGPADIIVDVPSSTTPGKGRFLLSGQTVEVEQVVAETHIDTSGGFTLPFDLQGWTAERREGATTAGISRLSVTIDSAGTSEVIRLNSLTGRVDVAAAFGQAYLNSGFRIPITRRSAGVYTVTAQSETFDGRMLPSVVSTIEVVRAPRLVVDGPATATPLAQPFRVFGWAADTTAPTGTGVDAVELTARPADGGPDVPLGTARLALVRTDVDAHLRIPNLRAGWDHMVTGLVPGRRYTIVARARYTATGRFETTAEVDVVVAPDALEADRSSILFAQSSVTHTGPQTVKVSISAGAPIAWDVTLDDPFGVLELRAMSGQAGPISGVGAGSFQVAIRDGAAVPGASLRLGAVRFTAPSASSVPEIPIDLRQVTPAAPWGNLDTPLHGATVSGAIGVTGWALDDVEVTRVTIYRDPAGGESGEIFVGEAVFVDGVRPDVAGLYPNTPRSARAGWGLSLLTNMLPNQGNGSFRLHAYAHDGDGFRTLLGSRTVTGANHTAALPFGTIDLPAQGATVSGHLVMFGWALTPGPAIIPTDGSTIAVRVDGQVVGHPTYNQCRGTNGTNFPAAGTCNDDIATLFGLGYRNLAEGSGAIASFVLDTTTLSNGLHQIDWLVTDSLGRVQGIGSRFIYVQN